VANSQALKDALADAEAAKEQLDNASGYGEVVAAAAEKPQAAAHSSFNLETPLMKQKKSQNMKLQVLVQVYKDPSRSCEFLSNLCCSPAGARAGAAR